MSYLTCPLCKNVYDENNRKPYFGTCRDVICLECSFKTTDCPVCKMKDAFPDLPPEEALQRVNWLGMQLLAEIKRTLTQENFAIIEPEKLDQGKCSECKQHEDKKLRICVTCARNSEIIHPQTDYSYALSDGGPEIFQLLEQWALCSTCASDGDHSDEEKHKLIPLSKIGGLSDIVDRETRSVKGKIFESALIDGEQTLDCYMKDVITILKRNLYRHEASNQTGLLREIRGCLVSGSKLEYPNLIKGNQMSVKRMETAVMKVDKLRERQLLNCKTKLETIIAYAAKEQASHEAASSEDWQKWQRTIDELEKVREQMNNVVFKMLEDEDIKRIDEATERRMRVLEEAERSQSFLQLDQDSKFFKYRALVKEWQEIKEMEEITTGNKDRVIRHCGKRRESRIQQRSMSARTPTNPYGYKELNNLTDIEKKINLMDNMEFNYRVEQKIYVPMIVTFQRSLMWNMMKDKYFPLTLDSPDVADIFYEQMLSFRTDEDQ